MTANWGRDITLATVKHVRCRKILLNMNDEFEKNVLAVSLEVPFGSWDWENLLISNLFDYCVMVNSRTNKNFFTFTRTITWVCHRVEDGCRGCMHVWEWKALKFHSNIFYLMGVHLKNTALLEHGRKLGRPQRKPSNHCLTFRFVDISMATLVCISAYIQVYISIDNALSMLSCSVLHCRLGTRETILADFLPKVRFRSLSFSESSGNGMKGGGVSMKRTAVSLKQHEKFVNSIKIIWDKLGTRYIILRSIKPQKKNIK